MPSSRTQLLADSQAWIGAISQRGSGLFFHFLRSVKLDPALTVKDVIDLVIRDVGKIVDNKRDIAVEV